MIKYSRLYLQRIYKLRLIKRYPKFEAYMFVLLGHTDYITNTGIIKLMVYGANKSRKYIFRKIKQHLMTNEYTMDDVCKLTNIARQRLHQYRLSVPKSYPELALLEGTDYKFINQRKIIFYDSALKKIRERQLLVTPRNKSTYFKRKDTDAG